MWFLPRKLTVCRVPVSEEAVFSYLALVRTEGQYELN
jgi:hypothetical protein